MFFGSSNILLDCLNWVLGNAAPAAAKSLQSCPTLRPHRRQPTRLLHSWDSPGKNAGVGCHFFLQCMKVKSESEVTQSCLTLRDPMDCSLPGSSVHGIFQATLSICPTLSFPHCVHKPFLYICIPIPALQIEFWASSKGDRIYMNPIIF